MSVVVSYAGNPGRAKEVVDQIISAGGTAAAVRADVADEADVSALFGEAGQRYGGVDVVVNAAGIMPPSPLASLDLGEFDQIVRTNLRGTFVVAQPAVRRARAGGAIITFSSSVTKLAPPAYAAYAATKGAVEARSLPQGGMDGSLMDLRLSVAALGRYLVITVRGELDLAAAPALASYLAAALDRQPGRDVILNVSGISFADAAGLSALLAADSTVRRGGASLRLSRPSRPMRAILALAGLAARLPSYPSTYAASAWPPVPPPAPDPVPAARPGPASPPPAAGQAHQLIRPGT